MQLKRDPNIPFSRILREVMLEKGFAYNGQPNQSALSRATGGKLSQTQVGRYLSGQHQPHIEIIYLLADTLGVDPTVLLGAADLSAPVSLGKLCAIVPADNIDGDPIRHLQCPVKCSAQTFALVVDDQANSPELEPGWVVFVDPDTKVRSGNIVAAKPDRGHRVILRQLIRDGETLRLMTRNPHWPEPHTTIRRESQVIGRAIAVVHEL